MIATTISTDHTNFVHHLAVNPSETLLASCSSDKTIQIYYREPEQNLSDNNSANKGSSSISTNANINTCADKGYNTNNRCMWSLKCVLNEHTGPIFCLAWCPHFDLGSILIAGGADRLIYMYRFIVVTHEDSTKVEYERFTPTYGLEKDVITGIAFVPRQGEMFMLLSTSSLDGCVRVYESKRNSGLLKVRVIAVPRSVRDHSVHSPRSNASSFNNSGGGTSTVLTANSKPVELVEAEKSASTLHKSSKDTLPCQMHSTLEKEKKKCDVNHTNAQNSPLMTPKRHASSPLLSVKGKTVSEIKLKTPISEKKKIPSSAEDTQESDGVTSFAWFPGAAERGLTLAIGTISGRCCLYYSSDVLNTEFKLLPFPQEIEEQLLCTAPIEDVKWTPPVGRRFHLLAICSRTAVFILRLNCISPSENWEKITFEVYQHNVGAVSASWSRSATQLHLVNDDLSNNVYVLQMRNPLDHQSWQCVGTF